MKCAAVFLFFIATAPLIAQTSDEISFQRTFLLRNASGTASNPGPTPHHPHLVSSGNWTTFFEGSAFLTYVSETGPEHPQNKVFSTNWAAFGARRSLGTRGLVLFRARVSGEPLTIPREGYPQLLQEISPESGGPLLDHMRAHELLGEIAAHAAWRTSTASYAHLYVAPAGDPPIGALPFAQRASAEEFAEAPFAYDVQEPFHYATRVVTAGWSSNRFGIEGGVFHHAITTDRHTTIEDGAIDSWAARLTITPVSRVSLQLSRANLTDADREVTSASLSYGSERVAASAIYVKRDNLAAGSIEATLRLLRGTFMARAESVDRPSINRRISDFEIGYLYDFITGGGYRTGLGVNFDYHTSTHDYATQYGHKPQSVYVFVRIRTDSTRR
ncbi:MAG: hypothetical protein ACXV5L_01815 [Thermoanaerobaculia bacterium]